MLFTFDVQTYRDKVMLIIVKAMKNPRSALCKTSIMASSDIFKAFGDKLIEPATSEAFDQVVHVKTSCLIISQLMQLSVI